MLTEPHYFLGTALHLRDPKRSLQTELSAQSELPLMGHYSNTKCKGGGVVKIKVGRLAKGLVCHGQNPLGT